MLTGPATSPELGEDETWNVDHRPRADRRVGPGAEKDSQGLALQTVLKNAKPPSSLPQLLIVRKRKLQEHVLRYLGVRTDLAPALWAPGLHSLRVSLR